MEHGNLCQREAGVVSNTSATGGYLLPATTQNLPDGVLTLEQFIQTVIVGISGYDPKLVRPKWQVAPPKQPDIDTDWIAYAISINTGDANAYVEIYSDGAYNLTRQEALEIGLSFYGPNAQENISAFRDGFQIQQNLEAMRAAKIGFTGFGPALHGPDLVNERWVDRYETSLFLVRQVLRGYQILSFASASGTIHTVLEDEVTIPFKTPTPP